eukprot:gene49104-16040_t
MSFGGRPPGFGRGRARGVAAPPPRARPAPLASLLAAPAGPVSGAPHRARGRPLAALCEEDVAAPELPPRPAAAAAAADASVQGENAAGAYEHAAWVSESLLALQQAGHFGPPAGGRKGGYFAERPALGDRSVASVLHFAAGDPTNRPRRMSAILGQERDRSDAHVASVGLQAAMHAVRPNTRRTYDTWLRLDTYEGFKRIARELHPLRSHLPIYRQQVTDLLDAAKSESDAAMLSYCILLGFRRNGLTGAVPLREPDVLGSANGLRRFRSGYASYHKARRPAPSARRLNAFIKSVAELKGWHAPPNQHFTFHGLL